METLNARTWDDASFRFHSFFIFYSRWTNPFLHSICIRARWLFFSLFFFSSWDDAFPKVRHVGSCDLTISARFHAASTFIFFFSPPFSFSSFLFFNQLKGAQSISRVSPPVPPFLAGKVGPAEITDNNRRVGVIGISPFAGTNVSAKT